MPKYVIERELPGAGGLSHSDLQTISKKSLDIINAMGPRVHWLETYVTTDKLYCVYVADSEKTVKEHAEKGGFPADRISRVSTVIDPTTAEK